MDAVKAVGVVKATLEDPKKGKDGGKIHAAMPGMESNTWVKDVIKIEVK